MALEIKGFFYQALRNVFSNVAQMVEPAVGAHFEGEIDADAWYDAGPYLQTVGYLFGRLSPEAKSFLGHELIEIARVTFGRFGLRTIDDFAAKAPALYHEIIRGGEAGEWALEDYRPGRLVIRETGFVPDVDFIAGVIRATLEELGGMNVRVTVLDDRAKGAAANRYVAEWFPAEKKK